MSLVLDRPWLRMHLPHEMRVLSWAPHGAGYTQAEAILWREVRNADLVPGFDAEAWLSAQMPAGAVGMLTSRDIGTYHQARARVEGVDCWCVATVGLSNGEAVGRRLPWHSADFGTINLGIALAAGLTEAAQLEAMSIAVQARTAGVIEAGVEVATGRVTGTGTDCVALACDAGAGRYAGLHTAVGEALGSAVRQAVAQASKAWVIWREAERARRQSAP